MAILVKRRKPAFRRTDSHKMIKLGKGVRKNNKWRAAKGRQSKIRLNKRNHSQRPRVGWGCPTKMKGQIAGKNFTRVETIFELSMVPKGHAVLFGRVGKKKRQELIIKAKEMKLEILNKYREKQHATG